MLTDYFVALVPSGDPLSDIARFLAPRRPDTWRHVQAVAAKAVELAARFGADASAARLAGYGHDLAAVVPRERLIEVAEAWHLPMSAEDRAIPQVLHGPLAALVLRERLGIEDAAVLDAVRYHTTLRSGSGLLDRVLFVADKLAYDPTTPRLDYLSAVEDGVAHSLDAAAYAYLHFVVTHQKELGWRLHPHLVQAHADLQRVSGSVGATSL